MKKRQEWAADGSDHRDGFAVKVMGGAWCRANLGKDYDCFRGQASGQLVKDFCTSHKLSQSSRYSIEKFGEHIAHRLAQAWCHKMNHLFRVWLDTPTGVNTIDRAALEAYVEDADFVTWVDGLGDTDPCKARVDQIRGLTLK